MGSLRFLATFALASALVSLEAAPGIVNFAEGKVVLNGQPLTPGSAETALLQPGQLLEIEQGRAEVLLTPGVFVRVGENSALKMDSVSANLVKVELVRGEAVVEVDQPDKNQRLHLVDGIAEARLDHTGVYRFRAKEPAIAVFSGRIRVDDDRRGVTLARGEELLLNGTGAKPQKFDRSEPGPLYAWSLQRAGYASQLSEWTGEGLIGLDGKAKYTDGWYWNPWYKSWAFVPEKGYVLTPFGYGLFAPQTPHYRTPSFGDFRS